LGVPSSNPGAPTKSLDAVLFGNAAATTAAPGGLLNGVTPLAASAATGIAGAAADLGALAGALGAAGYNAADMVVVTSPGRAVQLRALVESTDALTVGSAAVPATEVIAVAPSGIATGYLGVPQVETSKESTIVFDDAAPPPIGTPGSPPVVGAPTRSLLQQDLIGIKLRARAAWTAAPGAVALIQNPAW
jgi:hypothetical protein